MNQERWQRLKTLFAELSDLDEARRSERLQSLASSDPDLVDDLRQMLLESERISWLQGPLVPISSVDVGTRPRTLEADFVLAGRYRVGAFLGAGGMGEVYGALDMTTGQRIAIKTLRPDLAHQPEFIRRFKRELKVARDLHHENICHLYDIQQGQCPAGATIFFITMELIAGETLEARLAGGRMHRGQAESLVVQLLDGIAYAHANGVIHRDLKDSNIMLASRVDGTERVVITDFGLAREEKDAVERTLTSSSNFLIGTAAFMAPEQLEGKPPSQSSDIHALGVILFKMVTGTLPFEGETALAVALRRLRNRAPTPREFVKDLDKRWETTILACLDSDPRWRPASADVVKQMLNGEARPRRRIRASAKIGAAIAALVLIGVLSVLHNPSPSESNSEARRHFKMAEEFVKRRNAADLKNAVKEYESVLSLEPSNSEAWAGEAEAWAAIANYSMGDSVMCIRRAKVAAQKALELNTSARALGVMGYCLLIDIDHWKEAESYLHRAVQMDPKNGDTRLWYGAMLGRVGRSDLAIEQLRAGLREEPMSFALNQQLFAELLKARRFEEANDAADELVRLQPLEGASHLAVARVQEFLGNYDKAEKACDEAARYFDHPGVRAMRASLQASRGNRKVAIQMASELEKTWREGKFEASLLAKVYARLGDRRKVVELLKAGIAKKEASVLGNLLQPEFRPFFGDEEYVSMVRSVGLDPEILKLYK